MNTSAITPIPLSDMLTPTSPPSAPFAEKTVLSIILSLLGSFGLVFYFLVWLVIIHHYKDFKNPFYLYIISAGIPDMAFLLINLLYCIPCMAMGQEIYTSLGGLILGYMQLYVWLTQAAHIFYVAINRWSYVASNTYKICSCLPSCVVYKRTVSIIGFLWTTSFVLLIANVLTQCHWHYSFVGLEWTSTCEARWAHIVERVDYGVLTIFPIMATVMYAVTWSIIVVKRKNAVGDSSMVEQSSKREMRLLLQFSIITGVVLVYLLASWLAPLASHGSAVQILVNVLGILNGATNPFIYVIFDQKIQIAAKTEFKKVMAKIRQKQPTLTSTADNVPALPPSGARAEAGVGVSSRVGTSRGRKQSRKVDVETASQTHGPIAVTLVIAND